ncbi:hypothetical protein [Mesoflavibacter sp. CH_XMU1422-2]|uniref:hypothetical protein n=1 Tax=Mesoflavibacter sp. CH_XMU1422-2 TaxID=3107770 RepID=UPI003008110D
MKNLFCALAFMLMGTFAFANNAKEVSTVNYEEAVELVNSLDSSTTSYSVVEENAVDCLLKITFVFEDGSSETIYVLVRGASCEEILG